MLRRTFFSFLLAATMLVAALPGIAQRGGGRGAAAGQTVEKIKMLKPNLYEVTGGGANTLIRVTNQGLIVVDTKNLYSALEVGLVGQFDEPDNVAANSAPAAEKNLLCVIDIK